MLPEWLDYSVSENTAAAMLRGLTGLSANWGELVATAQVIMSHYQEYPFEQANDLYLEEQAIPLIAAARILDAASFGIPNLPRTQKTKLELTAAVAFAMYGNFTSAEAVINRILKVVNLTPSLRVLIATIAPNLIGSIKNEIAVDSPEFKYIETLLYYCYSGDQQITDILRDLLIKCLLRTDSAHESSLLRSSRLCLEHLLLLSVSRVLKDSHTAFTPVYIGKLIDNGCRTFLPPQYRSIVENKILSSNRNALISLPTSTGKTFLGELCLMVALENKPGICVFLVPYLALGRQVAETFERHLPHSVRVHRMMGWFKDGPKLDPDQFMEVVVATPERFDALLRHAPDLISHFRCVVCDEAHIIQSDIRGLRLEGLLTRLRLLQTQGLPFRIVLLSAVLTEHATVAEWIGADSNSVVTNSWRPTARRLAFWKQTGELKWHVGDDPICGVGDSPESSIGSRQVPWPRRNLVFTDDFVRVKSQQPLFYENVAYLADVLIGSHGGPVLCVCATKEGTRQVANALADRFPVIDPIAPQIASIIARIESRHRFLLPLVRLLKHGVVFHNASVPHDVRHLIEHAIEHRCLRAVAATTTLAEGVDLPFRFTILVDWLLWGDGGQQPMSSLLFRNIAGRCGRARVFTEGDTVIVDNPLGDVEFTDPEVRNILQNRMFLNKPDSLRSAVDFRVRQKAGKDNSLAAESRHSVLASQFMACIPENPLSEYLMEDFVGHSFAARSPESKATMLNLLSLTRASLLDHTDAALAVAASPIKLTEFGQVANRTGFSPTSCRHIKNALATTSLSSPVQLCAFLLAKLGHLPEQNNGDVKKILLGKRSTLPVKPTDFVAVINMWLKGEELEQTFSKLPSVLRSSRKPKVDVWLVGQSPNPDWNGLFDKFVDFTASILEGYLPWLMRACGALVTQVETKLDEFEWSKWAEFMERGVDSRWALAGINFNAPGGRTVIAPIGRLWPGEIQDNADPLGLQVLNETEGQKKVAAIFAKVVRDVGGPDTPIGRDMRELHAWLYKRAGMSPTEGGKVEWK